MFRPRYELEVATERQTRPQPGAAGTKRKRPQVKGSPDTTMISLSELPQDKLLAHLRTYKVRD
jgi:hypothetical protein